MIHVYRTLALCIAAVAILGGSMQAKPPRDSMAQVASGGQSPLQTAARPGEDPQTAYRRELLNNQLRHAQLDLQSATNESERQSIQERIDTIQQVLASLDARR
jgi:hypothetical protein